MSVKGKEKIKSDRKHRTDSKTHPNLRVWTRRSRLPSKKPESVKVALNDITAVFHRPHPEKETDKGAIKSVRRFLTEAGMRNDEL